MPRRKPTSRFTYFLLIFLLILVFVFPGKCSDEDDTDGIEELIALDEEADSTAAAENHHGKPSEAEVLSKAQRIVHELNDDNTRRVVEENEYVLVMGYAPWCTRSADLMPRFAEAATSLRQLGSRVSMAKIDADRYPKAASFLGIKGFPTLLLFINGSSQPYTGGFSYEEIVIWARKKTGVPVIRINSVVEAHDFLKKQPIFAVGFFEKFEGFEYEEFVKAAASENEIQFVETNSIEIVSVLFPDVKPTNRFFGLVKTEPERYCAFEDTFKMEKLLQFLDDNRFPLVTILTELNSARVYSNTNKLQVYVFAEDDKLTELLEPLQNIARKFKSKIMIIFVDIREDNLAKPFLTLLGLEESEDTVVAAFDYNIGSKYLLESNPAPKNLEEFCSGLLHGTLSPYYKSQPVSENKDEIIQTVVGKTFDELVLNSPKNIVLEVHTPWCINCEAMNKQVEKLAKHFKGLENLIFARIDASANEHPKLQVDDYPTLLFYPANDKSNPITFPTKAGVKELAALINKNLKAKDHTTKDEL